MAKPSVHKQNGGTDVAPHKVKTLWDGGPSTERRSIGSMKLSSGFGLWWVGKGFVFCMVVVIVDMCVLHWD